MRKMNYKAVRADGTEFITTSYSEATEGGNRITETYLTDLDERTDKQKKWAKAHAQKVQEVLKRKRG